jgi:hypothetical protein
MSAWHRLLADPDWCRGKGKFPLPAYSEFVPPPWLGPKPYAGHLGDLPGPQADDFGWAVDEYEEEQQLLPGLEVLARHALDEMARLGHGLPTPHLSRSLLKDNPCWPDELAARAGKLDHERYVLLLAVALARTQDDKGRVRWTLFGSSEQGPAKAFWRGLFTAPGREADAEDGLAFFRELLTRCHGVPARTAHDPARAGVRVLPTGRVPDYPRYWDEGPLPSWCGPLLYDPKKGLTGVKYLLTFRPFAYLPADVRRAYLAGELHLWPFPGSLVFWRAPRARRLGKRLSFAAQVPLLRLFPRISALHGVRVPQSGRLHEKVEPGEDAPGVARPHYTRTHRWQKVLRHQDEVAVLGGADRVGKVLFSVEADDLGLYGKPMARNAQLWSHDQKLVLDGPCARPAQLTRAAETVAKGGHFGYRFLFPAMRVGPHEVYWHRPVAAFAGGSPRDLPGGPLILLNAPGGYLTAYDARRPNLARPIELWPRWLDRPEHLAAVELFAHEHRPRRGVTAANVRALFEWHELLGGQLPPSLARALLEAPHRVGLEAWLASLPARASNPHAGKVLAERLSNLIGPEEEQSGEGLTYPATATRDFEERYWHTIAELAHGRYRNKSVADCVHDEPTREALKSYRRQLEGLARHLVRRHARAVDRAGMAGRAWVAEQRFGWRTDFDYSWMGGWQRNQKPGRAERNVFVRVPGRDPSQAVIMADHYDTAYMHDVYEGKRAPQYPAGARLAAAGADDNHSATSALLLACPILLELSKAGKLACDVWLVHLTGEEFPADCLGARNLCQALVEGRLMVKEPHGPVHDLSAVRVRGVFVSDMIAHNRAKSYVFQIAPGTGPASARLALEAHGATEAWNAVAADLNRRPPRKGAGPARRSHRPAVVPPLTRHALLRGQVRPDWTAGSTLFNTDGQIFSDVGVPVVLFMEDYDISRKGYHDTEDTMGNIDLDYGSALAAVVIETVARVAARKEM